MRSGSFDKFGMVPFGENAILFLVYHYVLTKRAKKDLKYLNGRVNLSLDGYMGPDRKDVIKMDEKGTFSHDNMTAIYCISKHLGLDLHKKFLYKQWWRRIHPRDIIFYLWAKGGISQALITPFFWIHTLIVCLTCFDAREARPGVLDTDGKLLTWLRINSFNMPLTKYLTTCIINKRHGGWKRIFEVYFPTPHLNSRFEREAYE